MKQQVITLVPDAIQHDGYSKGECDFSVTEILKPPQQTALSVNHKPQNLGAYSNLPSWVGTACHEGLEGYGRTHYPDGIHEERFLWKFEINGKEYTLGGKPDILHPGKRIIQDFKFTKESGLPKDDEPKPDHYWQAQINSYLARRNGIPMDFFQIDYVGVDWRRKPFLKAGIDKGPWIPICGQILPDDEILPVLLHKLTEHVNAKSGEARGCTAEERWAQPDKYALQKKGAKKARKLCESEIEANLLKKQGEVIEHRPGKQIRCESYCSYSDNCAQFKWSK